VSLQARFKKQPPTKIIKSVATNWPRWMTLQTAAEYTSHSVDLIQDAIDGREFPTVPKGKGEKRQHVVIDMFDLDAWLEKKKVRVAA
jgi:hypothetical protein